MPKTILLADDSPIIGQTLYRALATEGSYDLCAQAADGSEAISLAKRYKPDLVILDLAMPKMNGLETARELKKIMPTVPIILLTLHASTVRESFAGDSCVDLVIPKGDFASLMAHLRTLLCAEAGEDNTQFSEPQMRKRQLSTPPSVPPSGQAWLDLDRTAVVEVTSEEDGYPIESALLEAENHGWRAANPGPQTIRLIFDEPQKLRRIWLVFEDTENRRTQEFVLRWCPDTGHSFREIVRQQWNFSPPDSVRETEDYTVELSAVTALELIIVPDKSGGAAQASLASLRLA